MYHTFNMRFMGDEVKSRFAPGKSWFQGLSGSGSWVTCLIMRKRHKPGITQVLLMGVVVLVLLGVGTILGLSWWVGAFLRGEDFRALVAERTGKALAAEVSFDSFRWSGPNLFTEKVSATGLEGSRIESVNARQVRAVIDWRAAWGGAWKVNSIEILELDVVLQGGESHTPSKVEGTDPPQTAAKKGWLPQRFELGFLRAVQGTVSLNRQGGQTSALSKSVMTLESKGSSYELTATGGLLDVANLPQMSLESAHARVSDGVFFLTHSAFHLDDSGKLNASGEFGEGSTMQISGTDVKITPFLNPDWQTKLTGRLSGDAVIVWPKDQGPSSTTGKFVLKDGRLENVPLLAEVAKFTSSPQFRRMPLQNVSGNFQKDGDILTVTDFVGESKGLMRLEGGFEVRDGGALSGTFRVGVSPQVLQWVPGSREKVFTENRDGYVWTDLLVGGTLEQPTENLSARLALAMGEQVIDQGTQMLKDLPAGTREGVKGVLDVLTPLLSR